MFANINKEMLIDNEGIEIPFPYRTIVFKDQLHETHETHEKRKK